MLNKPRVYMYLFVSAVTNRLSVPYFQKLLDELENGDIPSHIREARLDHFKEQAKELHYLQEKGHGTYRYKT